MSESPLSYEGCDNHFKHVFRPPQMNTSDEDQQDTGWKENTRK